MVKGRGGAGGVLVLVTAAIVAPGCLTRQAVDEAGSSSEASSGGVEASTGGTTMTPELMTTTDTPETAAPASCDDGQVNQDETDVDCGGSCPACGPGGACEGDADCATQACAAGVCVMPACFTDEDCAGAADPCTSSRCGPQFTCVQMPDHEGDPCDDDAACSTASACQAGACVATAMVDCSAMDSPCTAGVCDPLEGACLTIDTPDGDPCDDGDACTETSTCTGGACIAGEPGALLFEDFAGAAAGWTFDGMWEVGPASASSVGAGGVDPASDHSPGDDDRLAGVAIGGLDETVSHAAWCLTSPPVDATGVGPSLHVSYWRHLHAPGQPQVVHTIAVWNGAAWKTLETGYVGVTDDAAWTFRSHDASAHKAADFRLRICQERKAGAPDYAGWSVDDVTIAATACTP